MSIVRRNHDGTIQGDQTGSGGLSDGDYGDIVVSGAGTVMSIDSAVATAAGRALLDDANAAAQRTTLGLGTAALNATGDFDAAGVAAAGDAAHVAAGDPHPQYLTAAEGNADYVPVTRTVTAGAGMTGGGALSADITLNLVANADGTIAVNANDIQVGTLVIGNIPNDLITLAKLVNASAASKLLGRGGAAGAGDFEEITLGTNLSMSGTTLNAAGGSATMTEATITVAYGSQSATATVVDAGISGTSKIMLGWGNVLDADENSPEMDNVTFGYTPAAGSMTVRVSATGPTDRVGGAYKINYMVA